MAAEHRRALSVQEARKKMALCLPSDLRKSEHEPLLNCLGRRLTNAFKARENVPGFTRSKVDGYAVQAHDTSGAAENSPVYLVVTGEIRMGTVPQLEVCRGEAMQVATGSMLPRGADAVVMIEQTGKTMMGIEVVRQVEPGENVIYENDDVPIGAEVFSANHLIRPQDMGLLAALGETEPEVHTPLRVGIISTGSEIVPSGETPSPGKIRDSNSYALSGKVLSLGGEPVQYGVVRDDPELIREKMIRAHEETDLVILTGGSSVGERDHAARLITELGEPGLIFHGLRARPGKTTIGGVVNGKPVFGLPGYPVAVLVSFDLFIAPLLKHGAYAYASTGIPAIKALISRNLDSIPGWEDYTRVKLRREEGKLWADPIVGKSGLLISLTKADGMIRIPLASEGIARGTDVDVYLFGVDHIL